MASQSATESVSSDTLSTSEKPFEWLDGDTRGPEYVSYSQLSDLPACSFDFGHDGYAASSNHGGELLQMTAPSKKHGIVFARGDFEYSLYLALARGQKEQGGKSAFGLKVATSDELTETAKRDRPRFRPCCMIERGCFNYRWPFNEFCLHVDQPASPEAKTKTGKRTRAKTNSAHCICPNGCDERPPEKGIVSKPVGTLSLLSFIHDGTLYQVIRLGPRSQPSGKVDTANLLLTIEPPMRLQSFRHLEQENSKKKEKPLGPCGGKVSCLSGKLFGTEFHWQAHLFRLDNDNEGNDPSEVTLKSVTSKKDHVFKVDKLESLPRYQAELEELDFNSFHVFVASFRLSEYEETKRQTAERISSVVSHAAISQFVRKGKPEEPGTAAMWQRIFNDRQDKITSVSQLCEASVVGRCLEKIVGVDLIQAIIPQGQSGKQSIKVSSPQGTSTSSANAMGTISPPSAPTPHVTVADDEHQEQRQEGEKIRRVRSRKHLTLVSNMFLKANVDLKSMFWKARFLVKIDQLLCHFVGEKVPESTFPDQSNYDKFMTEAKTAEIMYKGMDSDIITAEATIRRIRYVIGELMEYLVRALLKPTPRPPILLPKYVSGEPAAYYAMITIYYVLKHYPNASWSWQNVPNQNKADDMEKGTQSKQVHDQENVWICDILGDRIPSRRYYTARWSNHTVAKVKYSMLEWLHFESIWSLQRDSSQKTVIMPQWHVTENVMERARYTAKNELLRRIASGRPYGSDDEIADRLAFLAEELWGSDGIPKHGAHDTSKDVANRITRRVEQREETRVINLCHNNPGKEGSDDGPWEVHALCHHSRLMAAHRRVCRGETASNREETEMQIEHYKSKFYQFLTSEASLTPCWERNNSSARRGFLRSETTAVLASTIVDIFQQDMRYYPKEQASRPTGQSSVRLVHDGSDDDVSDTADERSQVFRRQSDAASMRHLRHTGRQASIKSIMVEQLETMEQLASAQGVERRIDYLQFRPPQRYHPEEFFNSLDDTPEMYSDSAIATRELTLPVALSKVLAGSMITKVKKLKGPGSGKRMEDTKPSEPGKEPEKPKETEQPAQSESSEDTGDVENTMDSETEDSPEDEPNVDESDDTETEEEMEKTPFEDLVEGLCQDQESQETTKRLRELLVGRRQEQGALGPYTKEQDARKAAELLSELTVIDLVTPDPLPSLRPKPLRGKDGRGIVTIVSDSLIDQEVRHRFLLTETSHKLKGGLLRLLVHVLHPEIVECLKNHALRVSRFGMWTRQETVVVHVTLRSWARKKTDVPFTTSEEDDKVYLPEDMRKWLTKFNNSLNAAKVDDSKTADSSKVNDNTKRKRPRNPQDMELRVSSIGMSTNEFGDFSKCSIVSDLIDKGDIDKLGEKAQEIWDGFTHQPQAGRFIVFSLVLRLLCQGIVREYTELIDDFLEQTQLDGQLSYLQDQEKLQEQDSDAELRLSLWSLEALNKLSNTVSTSVQTIKEAIEGINEEIRECPGKRSPELENVYRNQMDMLERSFSNLTAIETMLEHKVELNTRYSSALSAVLDLRASRDSFKQNNTIQKLTYLTIGCLPIALTSALFAVPDNQDVIAQHTGKWWFIGAILITFVIIFFVAYFLDALLKYLRRVQDDAKTALGWSKNGTGV